MNNEIDESIKQGIALWWDGKRTEAGPFFRRALSLAEDMYGPDASEVIRPLFWLSGSVAPPATTDASQLIDSVELLQRALRIAETQFGHEDFRLVRIISALAADFTALDKYEQAHQYYLRALHISERAMGEGPSTRLLLTQLTDTLLDMKRPAEALPFAERALHLEEPRKDDLAPVGIGLACRALGRCLMGVGRNEEAILCLERSLAIFRARHPGKKNMLQDELLGWIEELRKRS
jgi:tetratricopeptide (TPR) repeat protein